MTETKTRTVLLASESGPERDRLKKALASVFSDRKEVPYYREVADYRKLLVELQSLEKNLVTLVVISGFEGRWHMLFGNFAALVESQIAGVFMSKNTDTLSAAQKYGLQSVTFAGGENQVALVAAAQLAKLQV
jgi:hypothetical protein